AEAARNVMAQLNDKAASCFEQFGVNACTDVTGFGLLGHLKEMVQASAVSAVILANDVPLIDGVEALAAAGHIPGGTKNNLDFVKEVVSWDDSISDLQKFILCDAQTSGGLLVSLPHDRAQDYVDFLNNEYHIEAALIGMISKGDKVKIAVT
nr:bifunctional IscS subfamily cysteine desulfurase/selenide, water dikinase SelD [Bacteroidota bacterium]